MYVEDSAQRLEPPWRWVNTGGGEALLNRIYSDTAYAGSWKVRENKNFSSSSYGGFQPAHGKMSEADASLFREILNSVADEKNNASWHRAETHQKRVNEVREKLYKTGTQYWTSNRVQAERKTFGQLYCLHLFVVSPRSGTCKERETEKGCLLLRQSSFHVRLARNRYT